MCCSGDVVAGRSWPGEAPTRRLAQQQRRSCLLPQELLEAIVENLDKCRSYQECKALQACALANSRLRPAAQRKLFEYIQLTIGKTLKEGTIASMLCCFSTTGLAKHVRTIVIQSDGWEPGRDRVSVNVPELQKVLALIADCRGYEMVNGQLTRRESSVTELFLYGLMGLEWQIHGIIALFPKLRELELWDVDLEDDVNTTSSPKRRVVFAGTDESELVRHDLRWLRSYCCSFSLSLGRLFPPSVRVNLKHLDFEPYHTLPSNPWINLLTRAADRLETLTLDFADVDESTGPVDLSRNTRLRALLLRDFYIAEDTADWLVSTLASIKTNSFTTLVLRDCSYDTQDITTPGAAAVALGGVDTAFKHLQKSTGGMLRTVVLSNIVVRKDGQSSGVSYEEWGRNSFPKAFQAGLLTFEGQLRPLLMRSIV